MWSISVLFFMHAFSDTQNILERAEVVWKSRLQKFVGKRLISKEISFYNSID